MSSQIPHDIRKEVASENLPQNINTINNNNNLDLLTSNPYATNSPKSASSSSAPNHYMPNSPNQIFFASSPLPLLGLDGKHKSRVRNGTEGNGENEVTKRIDFCKSFENSNIILKNRKEKRTKLREMRRMAMVLIQDRCLIGDKPGCIAPLSGCNFP